MTIYFISTLLFTLAIGYMWTGAFVAGLKAWKESRGFDGVIMFLMVGMLTIPLIVSMAAIFKFY